MSQKLRIIIPLALLGAAGVAYAAHVSAGTLSAFGWESISLICPIGALGTMLASKMLVPRAVISIVLARGRHPAFGARLLRVALPRARMEQAARHLQEGRHLYGRGCLRDLLRARLLPLGSPP